MLLVREIRSQLIIVKFEEEMKSQREEIIHTQRTLRVKNDLNVHVRDLNYK